MRFKENDKKGKEKDEKKHKETYPELQTNYMTVEGNQHSLNSYVSCYLCAVEPFVSPIFNLNHWGIFHLTPTGPEGNALVSF